LIIEVIFNKSIESRSEVFSVLVNNRLVCDLDVVTKFFNDHFIAVGLSVLTPQMPDVPDGGNNVVSEFSATSYSEVYSVISTLRNSAGGYGRVKDDILRDNIEYFSEFSSCSINSAIASGIFPESLKISKVSNISNYRPISVNSIFSKIFESVIKKRMFDFLKAK
jgi:hypothetical protein